MKNLSKFIVFIVLIIFSKSIFAMNYRGGYDIENGNNGISVELKRLNLNQFLKIFPGIDDKKREVFKNFDIIEVAVTNVNESDYYINSDIIIPAKFYEFNDYSKLESFCDNGCKVLAGLVSIAAVGVSGAVFIFSLAFDDVNLTYNSMLLGVPMLVAYLGYKGVKFACIDDSKEDRDEKMYEFFDDQAIIFGQTIIKANSQIKRYCLFFRNAKKYNLIFTNTKNSNEKIVFKFFPEIIVDKQNDEVFKNF